MVGSLAAVDFISNYRRSMARVVGASIRGFCVVASANFAEMAKVFPR